MTADSPLARLGLSTRAYVLALSFLGLAGATVNNDAEAYEIKFETTASVGPDGPWNYILLADPENSQYIASLPSIARTSLMVNASACEFPGANCPSPKDQTWKPYAAWKDADGPDTKSYLMPASDWDSDYAALLNMTGAGGYFVDQVVLQHDAEYDAAVHLPNQFLAISKDWHVNVGENYRYTKSVGLFSLNGTSPNFTYARTQDEYVTAETSLQSAYDGGDIPSLSYGLHIGSVEPNVTGSLVLGGYDKSRILSDAIVAGDDNTFRLTDIALNVTSGSSAFANLSPRSVEGLLKTGSDFGEYVHVHPRPGVPYLYLPKKTCEAIAEYLPVTYREDYNLYLWDTEDSAYEDIISSPHYLSFIFSDDTKTAAHINVPFALLNLTLDSTLARKPTQYFPCSHWEEGSTGYTLGNAFLQAAFLSQHWQMNTTVLAQAPGPDYDEANIQAIPHDSDTAVGAATDAADWATTWAKTLKPLSGGNSSSQSAGGEASDSENQDGSASAKATGEGEQADSDAENDATSLSSGAIAGVVIGAVAGVALIGGLLWFLWRKRQQPRQAEEQPLSGHEMWQNHSPYAELDASSGVREHYKPIYEIPSTPARKAPTTQGAVELQADEAGGMRGRD